MVNQSCNSSSWHILPYCSLRTRWRVAWLGDRPSSSASSSASSSSASSSSETRFFQMNLSPSFLGENFASKPSWISVSLSQTSFLSLSLLLFKHHSFCLFLSHLLKHPFSHPLSYFSNIFLSLSLTLSFSLLLKHPSSFFLSPLSHFCSHFLKYSYFPLPHSILLSHSHTFFLSLTLSQASSCLSLLLLSQASSCLSLL